MKPRRTLARAVERADLLHDQCSPRAAAAALQPVLDAYDPATGCSDWLVIKAAILYAATAVDEPDSKLAWALFADRNSRAAFGPQDLLTVAAMTTLVGVTSSQDLLVDAITGCGRLIDAYTRRGEPGNALTWRRERAVLLHRDGQCHHAHQEIAGCLSAAADLRTAVDRRTAAHHALIQHTVMLAVCGEPITAVALLRRHHTLLPPPGSRERRADEVTVAGRIQALAATHPAVCEKPGVLRAVAPAFWATAVRTAGRR